MTPTGLARRYPVVADIGPGFGSLAIALLAPLEALPPIASAGQRAHIDAATTGGGVRWAVSQHPPRVVATPHWAGLWCGIVSPEYPVDARAVKSALPRDLYVMKHVRQAAYAAGLALALQRRDFELLGAAFGDAIFEPAIGALLPGFFPARSAALEAGAIAVSFATPWPTLVSLCDSEKAAERCCAAVVETLAVHTILAHRVVATVAPGGDEEEQHASA